MQLEVVLLAGLALFMLALVAAAAALIWFALTWGQRARGTAVTLTPGPDGVVHLYGQVHESGRTLLAFADDRNHGRLELHPDRLVWCANDPDRSWHAPYTAIVVVNVRGAFDMTAGPGLDLDVTGLGSFRVNASHGPINRISRNDAKSMREAATAVALAGWLTGHGARIAAHLHQPRP